MIKQYIDAFHSLNSFLEENGSNINVKENQCLEQPLVILHTPKNNEYIVNPNHNISIGKNSKCHIIEIYVNDSKNAFTKSSKTSIHLKENACLEYTILQHASENDKQIAKIDITQEKNSSLNAQIINHGGKENNISFNTSIVGENVVCKIHALEHAKNKETNRLDLQINHLYKNGTSNALIRSILDDESFCHMNGNILVDKHIEKIKAELQHKTILLSDNAKIESKPQLEIYNDNVMCAHGSTISKLDSEALFYMNSRGISLSKAKRFLLQSFIAPIINSFNHPLLKEYTEQLLFSTYAGENT